MNKCYQCGWSNPDDTDLCQKCGQPIKNERASHPIFGTSSSEIKTNCTKCGYLLSSLLTFCPWCGEGKPSDDILPDSQPIINVKDATSEKSMERPYLERIIDGTPEIITLLDSREVVINGICYIYHHR